RAVPFSRHLVIDRSDFAEEPPPGFFRLSPGAEVRLRYGYFIRCTEVIKDEAGDVVKLRCTYDPESRGGTTPDGRKVQGTIHWLSKAHALDAEIRLYDRLFTSERPDAEDNFLDHLNPDSLVVHPRALIEPSLKDTRAGEPVQFERLGYFTADPDSTDERLVWNRTVTLRDTWAKISRDGDSESAILAKERAEARRAYKEEQRRRAAAETVDALEPEAQAIADGYTARGVSEQDARLFALAPDLAAFFDAAAAGREASAVAPWLTTELLGRLGERSLSDLPFTGDALGELTDLVGDGVINNTVGKKVLDRMLKDGERPGDIVDAEGLRAISDESALREQVDAIIEANPNQTKAYRGGKTALLGFFIGQVMQATGGRADAQTVRRLLQDQLG
ncbi:MAG: glutamine--tRNA ligase, partial [Acidobacteriota bacterium]